MRRITSVLLLAASALSACHHPPVITDFRSEQVIEPGLRPFPTPRDYDGVGTIFRIGRDNVMHPVTTLALNPVPVPRAEILPVYSFTDTVGADLLLNFLKERAGSPQVGAAIGNTVSVQFAAQGTRREVIDDFTLRSALQPVLGLIDFANGGKYYVITETVLADSVAYTITQSSVDSLGGSANFQKLLSGNVGVRNKSNGSLSIVARLNPAMRVFYKVERLSPHGAGLGGRVTDPNQVDLLHEDEHGALIVRQ